MLNQKLILLDFFYAQFGLKGGFVELQRQFSDMELDAAKVTGENSEFCRRLADDAGFGANDFRTYDANIIRHLERINRGRGRKISLKYFQYFSLLFTERYLHLYAENPHDLQAALNQHKNASLNQNLRSIPNFTKEELNKLAFWNATGSGKTFLLHINILQAQHYAATGRIRFQNYIVITPNETLSQQHYKELEDSGIEARYYLEDRESAAVKVIDINKIREFSSGTGVTIPVSEFESTNAIFVDEGHKGSKSEDSTWRSMREQISAGGFAFEYSATFGQIDEKKETEIFYDYAKSIAFDYSYGRFYRDGYGKDYRIDTLSIDKEAQLETKHRYLLVNMLLFLQQKIYYIKQRKELETYNIEDPLLVFVGTSVEPKPSSKEKEENEVVISDVKTVLDFFSDVLGTMQKYVDWIGELWANQGVFAERYHSRLTYLHETAPSALEVYRLLLRHIFHTDSPGELELDVIGKADGEIGIAIKNNERKYFGLVFIGDVGAFKAPIETQYEFRKDSLSEPLFPTLSDTSSSPVNILIGARKFIEGWNNYRVSNIGLINFGKSKGAQIIQLFGRGVRLLGKDFSLKRSYSQADSPKNIHIAETLNVFGLNADYMKRFREDLEKEGINTVKERLEFVPKLRSDISSLGLTILEKDDSVAPFYETPVFELDYDTTITVALDYSSKQFSAASGKDGAQNVDLGKEIMWQDNLTYVNWEAVQGAVQRFRAERRMWNLIIDYSGLQNLCSRINADVRLDYDLILDNIQAVRQLNKIVVAALRKYIEVFYKQKLNGYEGRHLRHVSLTETHSNLSNWKWEVEIIRSDAEGNDLQGITAFLIEVRKMIEEEYPKRFKGSGFILNSWLDNHLYQPLLLDANTLNTVQNRNPYEVSNVQVLDTISPKGLNEGEARFVELLKRYVSERFGREYPDWDLYLLRNLSRGKGFGFYFESTGFYPDFMMWLKNPGTGEQHLAFIDPHGLRNEDLGWKSPKIQLHKAIKQFQNDRQMQFHSFILSPSPLSKTGMGSRQIIESMTEMMSVKERAETQNVFEFMVIENIHNIIKRILS